MSEDLKNILEKAKNATPGPWDYQLTSLFGDTANPIHDGDSPYIGKITRTNDLDFISFVDPTTITAIIEELIEARSMIENLITASENMYDVNKEDIECRSDEDCDHCFWAEVTAEANDFMKKWSDGK